jgi:phage terminase Nu1 subunit (DNA packaging protein)
MTLRAVGILDDRIREVSALSEEARKRGDKETMYKLNTAYHYLASARDEIANGERVSPDTDTNT